MNVPPVAVPTPQPTAREIQIRAVAEEFEATFLQEMLKNAGLTGREGEFSGGVGEEAFSGLLTQQYASAMTDAGGIGLAEWIYTSLIKREGA